MTGDLEARQARLEKRTQSLGVERPFRIQGRPELLTEPLVRNAIDAGFYYLRMLEQSRLHRPATNVLSAANHQILDSVDDE